MQNFAEIASEFLANEAAVQVQSTRPSSRRPCWSLVDDPVRRASLGAAARALVEANRGARERTLRRARTRSCRREPRGAVVHPFRRTLSDVDDRRVLARRRSPWRLGGPAVGASTRGGRRGPPPRRSSRAQALRAPVDQRGRRWPRAAAARRRWRRTSRRLLRDAGERPVDPQPRLRAGRRRGRRHRRERRRVAARRPGAQRRRAAAAGAVAAWRGRVRRVPTATSRAASPSRVSDARCTCSTTGSSTTRWPGTSTS